MTNSMTNGVLNDLKFFAEIPGCKHHLMATALFLGIGTLTSYFYNKIANEEDKTMYICAWLFFVVLDKLVYSLYACPVDILFQHDMKINFNKTALAKYSMLNHTVKCKEPLNVYQRKIAGVITYYEHLSSFGVFMFINVFSACVDVFITLSGMPAVLATICVMMSAFAYYMITNNDARDARKNHIKRRDELSNLLTLEETYFNIGKKSFLTIIDIMNKQFENTRPLRDVRRRMSDLSISNEVLIIAGTLYVCCHMDYAINVVNIIRVLITFSSSIKFLTRFCQNTAECKMKYEEYGDFWKENDKNIVSEPIKLDFPKELKILSIDYQRPNDNYHIVQDDELTLIPGDVLKISGGSGIGKSSFCDLMLGRDIVNDDSVSALTFEHGSPRQFMHHMCECGQDTSTQLNWSVSTVRQHFEGELDDKEILHFCELMFIKEKVESLGLDEPIKKSVSGGEQQRITLASNLYFAKKHKSKVLIFDEPEKGLGSMARMILDNLTLNKDAIVIISTHVQEWYAFNKQLQVTKDGNKSRINVV
jgi:ABC-type dipeptide/oligopeptide/nickel transport system ATPase subunit